MYDSPSDVPKFTRFFTNPATKRLANASRSVVLRVGYDVKRYTFIALTPFSKLSIISLILRFAAQDKNFGTCIVNSKLNILMGLYYL